MMSINLYTSYRTCKFKSDCSLRARSMIQEIMT